MNVDVEELVDNTQPESGPPRPVTKSTIVIKTQATVL